MKHCVVVGYHETDMSGEELDLALEQGGDDLPAPIRSMLRTKITLGGTHHSYLDALSRVRTERTGVPGSYTVAELPSLGTLYLVNYLEEHGHPTDFVNSFTYERERLAKLLADGPASVAITTTFYMMPAPVIEIIRFVRQHNATVPIIVGGPLIDNHCREGRGEKLSRFFDRVGADFYVWESQGEEALAGLVGALVEGASPAAVPNVFARADGEWKLGRKRPENNDLNRASVRWHRFGADVLGRTVSTRTARSCAFNCAFCDYPERAGALTLADLSTVERELEELAERGVKRVAFIDDTFNVPMRRFKDLCRMMVRRDFGIEWFSYFRCGHAREPGVYDLMYDSGCRGVLLGIESGDDQVLLNMDKRATTEHYRYGIEQLKARGIFTHASFVVGFPGESPRTVRNTIDFINNAGPDTFAVNHWYYLHSTPIHVRAPQFDLTGNGFTWSHRTMDSRQALEAADEIFDSVHAASWMPVNGLDFWGVPYLLGKGMSREQVVEFLALAKPLTTANVARSGPEAAARAEARFRSFVGGLHLEPARYDAGGQR
ncbi:PhpK family radical SAM P-methyltransferase [Kitasatospora phosalacinea]|uniref:PhpK n=1 Tax=Kitasatospora phosalacinea TaxID=2065 RepID=A0A0M3N271_9ACTN|nr:PhpK family radical SAM P-methyltransferase [Kitasatospora phosalacinea]AKO69613.1 PhpK [Kitasatospora phosalacinea]